MHFSCSQQKEKKLWREKEREQSRSKVLKHARSNVTHFYAHENVDCSVLYTNMETTSVCQLHRVIRALASTAGGFHVWLSSSATPNQSFGPKLTNIQNLHVQSTNRPNSTAQDTASLLLFFRNPRISTMCVDTKSRCAHTKQAKPREAKQKEV